MSHQTGFWCVDLKQKAYCCLRRTNNQVCLLIVSIMETVTVCRMKVPRNQIRSQFIHFTRKPEQDTIVMGWLNWKFFFKWSKEKRLLYHLTDFDLDI